MNKKNLLLLLLVEDDSLLGPLYVELLTEAGYEVLHAQNVTGARSFLSQQRPDFMLLDVMLPDLSGIEFLEELGKDTSLPILMLSNLDQPRLKEKALHLGAVGYVIKSEHTPETFLLVVRDHLKKYCKKDQSLSLPTPFLHP
jgi:DNA-binding response OmpR family regulator